MAQNDLTMLGYGRDVFEPEHEAFRETMRRFFQRHVEPNVRQWERDGFFPAELFREAGKAGLLCSGIPTDYGGGGGDVRHHLILHEEHCYSPAGAALESGLTTDISTYCIYNSGTEEQKKEWLPLVASGDCIVEIGLSEAGAGSDARGIKTFARRDGDDYVIDGQKMWVSNGPILTLLLLVAKTRSGDGREGTSMFLVPMDTKGVTCSKPTDLLLKNCGGVSEVFFDSVRVPARNILGGEEGKGLHAALGMLTIGRVATSARAMASSELALALTLEFVRNRKAFGQTIFEFQNTQFKLASVATEIAAGRALVDRAIRLLTEGRCDAVEAAKAKLFCTEAEGRVMDECLQLHGGAGFSNESPISKMFTLARVHRVYGGTSEIMRSIIGRSLA